MNNYRSIDNYILTYFFNNSERLVLNYWTGILEKGREEDFGDFSHTFFHLIAKLSIEGLVHLLGLTLVDNYNISFVLLHLRLV